MSLEPELAEVAQSPSPGEFVVLFKLDLSVLGGSVYHFTSSAYETEAVSWNGDIYTPVPIMAEGFEWTGRGVLPTPKVRIANVNRVFSALVSQFGDLVGASFFRTRTFRQFLDGQPQADPLAAFPTDEFRIERKSVHNKMFVEWELSAAIDQEGRLLPGRLCLRDTCTHRYRRYVAASDSFDYTKATCPYAGTSYFKETGETTAVKAQDRCGKKLSDCKKRFGENAVLPTRAFPGIARLR